MDPVPTWFFEYQKIASQILAQLSRYKRAESNLLAGEKGPQEIGQVALAEAKDLRNWLV